MMKFSEKRRSTQHGTSLIIIVLLLFCLTLILLHTARFHAAEQRISKQEVRAMTLLAAAQAGLETALGQVGDILPGDESLFDVAGRFEHTGPSGALDQHVRFQTLAHNRGLIPHSAALIEIEAQGSDEHGGKRTVRQQAVLRPWLHQLPPAPLVAGRGIDLSGAITIGNGDSGILAWNGGPFLAPGAALHLIAPPHCPPDGICADDARLAAFSAAVLAEYFLARSPVQLHALAGKERALHVHGDGSTAVRLDDAIFGDSDTPALLFIDGDLEIDGEVEIDGLLYVNGDWLSGSGTLTIRGAMIVAGLAHHQGRAHLHYDLTALRRLASSGIYARIAGSWTDL